MEAAFSPPRRSPWIRARRGLRRGPRRFARPLGRARVERVNIHLNLGYFYQPFFELVVHLY
jgi:hypothetical protein